MILTPLYGAMLWVNDASLYRTIDCGLIVLHSAATPGPGLLKANGSSLSKAAYAGLWSWANENSLVVSTATWAAGTAMYADLGGDSFRIPDLRGEFLRAWDDGRGIDSGRAFGTNQIDAIRIHYHATLSVGSGEVTQAAGSIATTPMTANSVGKGVSALPNIMTSKPYGATSTDENRPRNIALLPCIKF